MSEPTSRSYRWTLRGAYLLGVICELVAAAWLMLVIRFEDPNRLFRAFNGDFNYWGVFIFLLMITGPVMILPCALWEKYRPGWGAFALACLAIVSGEFGLFSAVYGGGSYDHIGAYLVYLLVVVPMLVLAVALARTGKSTLKTERVAGIGGLMLVTQLQLMPVIARILEG
jgi:hypothetical protein